MIKQLMVRYGPASDEYDLYEVKDNPINPWDISEIVETVQSFLIRYPDQYKRVRRINKDNLILWETHNE